MTKNLTIQVLGAPPGTGIHDIEVEEGTTVDDVLRQLDLRGFRLTRTGEHNFLDPRLDLHREGDGTKLEATREGKLGYCF